MPAAGAGLARPALMAMDAGSLPTSSATAAATPKATAFRVLTANIHMGFDMLQRRFVLPQLRDAIRTVGADIVFLQEVLGSHSGHAQRWRGWPQAPHYEFLADSLWPQFAYGRNAVYPEGHHGNALLSRLPIMRRQNHDISVAGHENRGLLHCELELPGHDQTLHAICVHLGLREAHRRRQLDLLCQELALRVPPDAPVVVAGDFNDWRATGHRRLRSCGLVEVFELKRGRLARSFPARWPLLPLDRLYVRGLAVHEVAVHGAAPWSRLSDHLPLSAHLSLPEAAA